MHQAERRIVHLPHHHAIFQLLRTARIQELFLQVLAGNGFRGLKKRLLIAGLHRQERGSAVAIGLAKSGPGRRDISRFFNFPFSTSVTFCAGTPSSSIVVTADHRRSFVILREGIIHESHRQRQELANPTCRSNRFARPGCSSTGPSPAETPDGGRAPLSDGLRTSASNGAAARASNKTGPV